MFCFGFSIDDETPPPGLFDCIKIPARVAIHFVKRKYSAAKETGLDSLPFSAGIEDIR